MKGGMKEALGRGEAGNPELPTQGFRFPPELGKDAFTWQAVERTAAGSPLAGTPPLKVTRVKAE